MSVPWAVVAPSTKEFQTDIGQQLLQTIFDQFRLASNQKIQFVRDSDETPNKALCHSLLRGADKKFDRLIVALSGAAQVCLASFAKDLLLWWGQTRAQPVIIPQSKSHGRRASSAKNSDFQLNQKQAMAADYLFGRMLIEMLEVNDTAALPQEVSRQIERLTFQTIINSENMFKVLSQKTRNELVELYAVLIGVMSQQRFDNCTSFFVNEIKTSSNQVGNINLMKAMKKVKLKTYPMQELERSAEFLNELGNFYVNLKGNPEVKLALSDLFVELVVPLAATFKSEVNLPGIRNFVETVYARATKTKAYSLSFTTVLICCSQKQFFLDKWPSFLTHCLSSMKDSKLSEEAVLSIHRCLWIYMYRVGGQSNQDTESRMKSIIAKCFPKSPSSGIFPKDTPVDVFVDILLFMSEIRIDFVFREAIFPLLGMNLSKPKIAQLCPIRMAIAIKASRVIADMRINGEKPKFCTQSLSYERNYEQFFEHIPLTSDQTMEFGFGTFMSDIRQFLGNILVYVNNTVKSAEFEKSESSEDYINLYLIILSSIPRLFPTGLPDNEVIYTICTVMTHSDERLQEQAVNSLRRIIQLMPELAHQVVQSFARVIIEHVDDEASLMDPLLLKLKELVMVWKKCVADGSTTGSILDSVSTASLDTGAFFGGTSPSRPRNRNQDTAKRNVRAESLTTVSLSPAIKMECEQAVVHVERLCVLCLCSPRSSTRKLAIDLLTSCRILTITCQASLDDLLINLIDQQGVSIAQEYIALKMKGENIRSVTLEYFYFLLENESTEWYICLGAIIKKVLQSRCNRLINKSWEIVCERFMETLLAIDHVKKLREVPGGEYIGGSNFVSKISFFSKEETVSGELIIRWYNYLTFLCAAAPKQESNKTTLKSSTLRQKGIKAIIGSTSDLFKCVIPFLRHEDNDIARGIIHALASVNSKVYKTLVQELRPYHELCKTMKSEKKRRTLRERLACILEYSSVCFEDQSLLKDDYLQSYFTEYMQDTHQYLLQENPDGDDTLAQHYSNHLFFMMQYVAAAGMEDKYFPVETRKSLYSYFSTFSGIKSKALASASASASASTSTSTMRQKDVRKRTGDMMVKPRRVIFVAVRCMAAMHHGSFFDKDAWDFNSYIFKDISFMFSVTRLHVLGMLSVKNLLQYNQENSRMLDLIIYLCYVSKGVESLGFFSALAEELRSDKFLVQESWVMRIISLVLFQTGNSNQSIRKTAIPLMTHLVNKYLRGSQATPQHLSVTSVLSATYTLSQQELSADLAKWHPEKSQEIISEIMSRMVIVPHSGRTMMLQYMLPWIAQLDLQSNENLEEDLILSYLFDLTVKYEESHPKVIESLWKKLSETESNLEVTLEFLIDLGTRLASSAVVVIAHTQKIAVYLGRTNAKLTLEKLSRYLVEVNETPHRAFPRVKDLLHEFLSDSSHNGLEKVEMNRSVFALCTCVELVTEAPVELLLLHLPVLFQLIFIHMDSRYVIIYQLCKILLSNIMHSLVTSLRLNEPNIYEDAQNLIQGLLKDENKLWKVVDFMSDDYTESVAALTQLVQEVVRITSYSSKNIQAEWRLQAHRWAITCSNSHSANRSLQIYRALDPKLGALPFAGLVSRLSNTVIDEEHAVHTYVIEIMTTIQAMVKSAELAVLKQFPQILWVAIAILDCHEEYEWKSANALINCWVDRIPLSESQLLLEELNWPDFPGLHALLIKGLTSPVNMDTAIDSLSRCTLRLCEPDKETILDPMKNGYLFNLTSLLPYLISEFDQPTNRTLKLAEHLSTAGHRLGLINIAKLMALFGNPESTFVKSVEEWVKDVCKYISESYFPKHETMVINMMLILLESPYNVYQQAIFSLLDGLVQSISKSQTEFSINNEDPNNIVQVLVRSLDEEIWRDVIPTIKYTMKTWVPSDSQLQPTSQISIKEKPNPCWDNALSSQALTRKRLALIVNTIEGAQSRVEEIVAFDESENVDPESDEEKSVIKRAITMRRSHKLGGSNKKNWRATIKKNLKKKSISESSTESVSDNVSQTTTVSASILRREKSEMSISFVDGEIIDVVETVSTPNITNAEIGEFFDDFDGFLQEAME